MTQQREPKGTSNGGQFTASSNQESTVELSNEQPAESTRGLFDDVQQARIEAERREDEARAEGDIQTAEFWSGRKSGFDFVLTTISDSVWKPVHADVYPDEDYMLSVEVSVNRKTGLVNSRIGGKWNEHDEFDDAFELIDDAACEVVNLNPEEYVTDPAPRTVRLRQDTVPALDTFAEPMMLSEAEVGSSQFIYSDGLYVTLKLPDDRTVRVERINVDVEPNDE